jgi:hypothetical protein
MISIPSGRVYWLRFFLRRTNNPVTLVITSGHSTDQRDVRDGVSERVVSYSDGRALAYHIVGLVLEKRLF